MRRISSLLVLSTFALTACGGSDETAETAAPVETEAPQTSTEAPAATDAPAETTAAETTATETTAATETATESATESATETGAPSGAVAVSLIEWAIETPAEVAAGTVTFDITNSGNFPHHFAVARGNSYEELPMASGGAVDEAALGDDYLGRTDNLQSGQTKTIEFDLTPGNYVFFCNIAGTVSHAAQGQTLSVTVS